MAEKVYSQVASQNLNARLAVFFAGSDPLNSTLARLRSWLDEHNRDYVLVDVEQITDESGQLSGERDSRWLPIIAVDGQVRATNCLLQALLAAGQLARVFEETVEVTPTLAVSEKALSVWRTALRSPDDVIRLSISDHFEHSLSVDAARADDVRLTLGNVLLVLDCPSAARADGLAIDWVESDAASGFRVDNPNQISEPRELDCLQLSQILVDATGPLLIDVRTDEEFQDSRIPKFRQLNRELIDALPLLNRRIPLVFCCDNGRRSRRAALHYIESGFSDVSTLAGGVNAWKMHLAKSRFIG